MSEFSIRTKPFCLDWADYRALYLVQIVAIATFLPLAFLVLFLGVIFPVLESLVDLRAGHYRTYLIIQASVLAAYALAAVIGAFAMWLRYRQDPAMNGERIMILDAGAVRLVGPGFDLRQGWTLFRHAHQSRDHIFLRLRGYKAYVIPKRAFASPQDAQRLVKAARAAIRTTRTSQAALPALAETPDTRDIWRCLPYTMALDRPLSRVLRNLGTAALAVFGGILLVNLAQHWGHPGLNPKSVLVLFAIVAVVFVPVLLFAPIAWLLMGRQPDRRGLRDVCFTRDYVRSTGMAMDTRAEWALVKDIERSSGTFVFRLTIGTFCVPLSAFTTKAQATAFYTQAVAFWRAAEARR